MDDRIVQRCAFKLLIFILMAATLLFTEVLFHSHSHALIGLKEGDPPKAVTLNDMNGKAVNMADYFGKKPVILVFWKLMKNKAFLDYSIDELVFLEQYREKYRDKHGLEIVGIYTPHDDNKIEQDEITEVQNLIKVNKISFPVLIDKGLKIFKEYGVIALPSTIMIDKAGIIKFIYPSFPITAREVFPEQIMDLIGLVSSAKKEDEEKKKGTGSRSERLYRYALQMYKRGLFEQSVSPLKKSIELAPDYPWGHNLMGVILSKRGNFDESSAEFIKAIELDQNNGPAHFNYGLILFDNEKYKESAEYLKKSLAINKNMPEAHFILGLLNKKTGKTDIAMREFETAFDTFNKISSGAVNKQSKFLMISALYALSDLYAAQGNDKKALDSLRKAIQIALGLDSGLQKKQIYRGREFMMYE
jgi:Flp pilus assembly protein TadD/peroxiredoxin